MVLCQAISGKSCIVCSAMFSRLVSDLVVQFTNVPDVCSKDTILLMSSVANVAVRAGNVM